MNILREIEKHRKLQGLSWEKLAETLPISGNALRIAFTRNSVDEFYLGEVVKKLKVQYLLKNEQNEQGENEKLVNEPAKAYEASMPEFIKVDSDLVNRKTELYTLIKKLKTNHDSLMEDELFAMYCEFIYHRLDVQKAKESLRKLIDEQGSK